MIIFELFAKKNGNIKKKDHILKEHSFSLHSVITRTRMFMRFLVSQSTVGCECAEVR